MDEVAEVLFEVGVSRVGTVWGLTLFIDDGSEPDVVPCFRLMFRGPDGAEDDDSVARAFSECHQEAMESLGMTGEMTAEDFGERLMPSLDVAGVLMRKYGYAALTSDDVDEATQTELWEQELVVDVELDDEPDPGSLN